MIGPQKPTFADLQIAKLISKNDPLLILFSNLNFSHINHLLQPYYSEFQKISYTPESLFKALLLIYLGFAKSERDLARKLRYNVRLSYLCGFSFGKTPNHNTFHYFRKRIPEDIFSDILLTFVAQAICLIKAKNLNLIIDSSHISAFPSDKSANWGYKSKDFCFFGYKVHLEVIDSPLPIPISYKVTPANSWDGNHLPELTEKALNFLENKKKKVKALLADAGYDSFSNAKFLLEKDILPYIAGNPRAQQPNALEKGEIYLTPSGELVCKAGIKLHYWGWERSRKRFKFRCGLYTKKGEGCIFRNTCWKGTYGPCFYLKEGSEVKPIVSAIRAKKSFKKTYNRRTTIERLFGLLKNFHKLGELRFRGIKNVSFHVLMSFIAYLGRAIAGIKMNTGLLPV